MSACQGMRTICRSRNVFLRTLVAPAPLHPRPCCANRSYTHVALDACLGPSLLRTAGSLRPDFLAWVNGVLLLKGEEKAAASELQHAVQELTTKVSDAWAAGLLPHTPLPSMLAYAAAGAVLQVRLQSVFCSLMSGAICTPVRHWLCNRVTDANLPRPVCCASPVVVFLHRACRVRVRLKSLLGRLRVTIPTGMPCRTWCCGPVINAPRCHVLALFSLTGLVGCRRRQSAA